MNGMNKIDFIQSELNRLQQNYESEVEYLTNALSNLPRKYDMFSDYNRFPERKHLKCSCGNDTFYKFYGYVCSKCFLEWLLPKEWKEVSPEEQIIYYGIEIKTEEEKNY